MLRLLKLIIASLCFCGIVMPVSAQTIYDLQKALQTARANNPILKSEAMNIGVAETDITTAKLRPNLMFNTQDLQLVQSRNFAPNTQWNNNRNNQLWFQLTKQFQIPTVRQNKISVARKGVALQQNLYNETERNLFQDVANKWLDVWAAQKELEILQQAKNNIDTLVAINKERLKNQVITQTDFSRTELLANSYAMQIKTANQLYKTELANLKFMLGERDEIDVDTSENFRTSLSDKLDSLLEEALAQRSDIRAYQASIDVANSNIKLQKSLAIPTPELGVIYNPQNTIQYVGFYGTIALPFFSRNQGEIQKAKLLKSQAEQDLKTSQTQLQTELTNAYNNYETDKQNLQNFTSLLAQSETILSSVKYSYLRGGTTLIDFLEAQRSWLDTRQHYYQTMQQYRQSYIKLLYASGLINKIAQ
ncbi:MAG TPA: TolC family protein [Chitinophagales bacterium]